MSKFTLEWRAEKLLENVRDEVKTALRKSGLDLKQRSKDQAPIDTGDLRGNCAVLDEDGYVPGGDPSVTQDIDGKRAELQPPKALRVRVGYALPYALAQHENLALNHPMGGNAKYLESPFEANRQKYEDFIYKAVGKGLKK